MTGFSGVVVLAVGVGTVVGEVVVVLDLSVVVTVVFVGVVTFSVTGVFVVEDVVGVVVATLV